MFSIIFLLGGGGMLYYYSFLDTLNFKELDDTNNNNTAATNSSVAPLEGDATNLSLSEGELLQNSKSLMLCSLAKTIQTAINTAEVIQ